MGDVRRQLGGVTDTILRQRVNAELAMMSQLLYQPPSRADKIYALREPEVDCISKGKRRVRHDFG